MTKALRDTLRQALKKAEALDRIEPVAIRKLLLRGDSSGCHWKWRRGWV